MQQCCDLMLRVELSSVSKTLLWDDCGTGKGSWREGSNMRDSDRDGTSRGKHSRDDLRDERCTSSFTVCSLTRARA